MIAWNIWICPKMGFWLFLFPDFHVSWSRCAPQSHHVAWTFFLALNLSTLQERREDIWGSNEQTIENNGGKFRWFFVWIIMQIVSSTPRCRTIHLPHRLCPLWWTEVPHLEVPVRHAAGITGAAPHVSGLLGRPYEPPPQTLNKE